MFYKIVSNGQIVDASDGMSFVRWQAKNKLFLNCDNAENATGIISSDGSTIYLLEGAEPMNGMQYASYSEITEEDYAAIRAELVDNGILEDFDTENEPADDLPDDSGEDPDVGQEPVKKSKALLLAEQLQQRVEQLQEQNDFLTECLLEMSEIVYG